VSTRKYGNASPRAESDGARAYFAPLTDPPIGKPDVACQVGTPASAMLIARPEVRIQADPRPKPLVPRPLPLSSTPIPYPSSANVDHFHVSLPSPSPTLFLNLAVSRPFARTRVFPPKHGYSTFPFLGLVEPSRTSSEPIVRSVSIFGHLRPRVFSAFVSSLVRPTSVPNVTTFFHRRRPLCALSKVGATPLELRIEDAWRKRAAISAVCELDRRPFDSFRRAPPSLPS
jgi:hypothetical protein